VHREIDACDFVTKTSSSHGDRFLEDLATA
jgi:hypothetical protein